MADSTTPILGLTKPEPGASADSWGTKLNANFDILDTIKGLIYPVGSIYTNATVSTNPATLLGFGTWTAFGAGRVMVGLDSGNTLFDTAEETGGSANAITVAHTHTASSGNQSADHTHSGTTSTASLTGTLNAAFLTGSGAFVDNGARNYPRAAQDNNRPDVYGMNFDASHSHSITTGGVSANHNHAITVDSTGSSGTNANYQPYITVYMWKRTA